MKTENTTITIREKFKSAGVRTLDSKKRVSLGDNVSKNMKIDSYEVLVGEEGDILLRPMAHVPARERWIYENPKVLAALKRGVAQAKAGQVTKIDDIGKFLEDL